MVITVDNDIDVKIIGKPVEKNGETYMKITEFQFNIYPKGGHTRFENLFNGNKQLGKCTTDILIFPSKISIQQFIYLLLELKAASELKLVTLRSLHTPLPHR